MQMDEFNNQVERLKGVYGERYYPPERANAMWKEFQHENVSRFSLCVADFILNRTTAPMAKDFQESLARIREREYAKKKQEHTSDAKLFFNSSYAPEDTKLIVDMILKRIAGQVGDKDYADFVKGLKEIADSKPSPYRCKLCSDSGVVIRIKRQTGSKYAFYCRCHSGNSFRKYPSDVGSTMEYVLE